jgi:hypothetical protein
MSRNENDPSGGYCRPVMAEVAFTAAIGAALMLFVGFGLNLKGVADSRLYNLSVDGFTWTMKVGGILMGAVAVLLWVGWASALLVDAVLTITVGAIMIAAGGVWLSQSDMEGFLLLIFGALFLHSGRRSWIAHQALTSSRRGQYAAEEAEEDLLEADASLRSEEDRQAAMGRLLAAKRRESSGEASRPERTQSASQRREVPARPTLEQPAPARRRDALPAEPPREQPRPAPQPPAPAQTAGPDEPPPEGFLAQLGRDEK